MSTNKDIRYWRNRVAELGGTVEHVVYHGAFVTFHCTHRSKAFPFRFSARSPSFKSKPHNLAKLRRIVRQLAAATDDPRKVTPPANDNRRKKRRG